MVPLVKLLQAVRTTKLSRTDDIADVAYPSDLSGKQEPEQPLVHDSENTTLAQLRAAWDSGGFILAARGLENRWLVGPRSGTAS